MSELAVITGGSKKLGFAIAKHFISQGARTLLIARDEGALSSAVSELGEQAHFVVGSVLEQGTRSAAFDKAGELGGATTLINAAGHFIWKSFADLAEEDWDTTLAVQLKAPFLMTQTFAPQLAEGGAVVNVGSIHGEIGDANVVAQCAAKSGLIGLTQAMAEALRSQGTRVNAVLPGAIENDSGSARSQGLNAMITQGDVASAAYFLGSAQSAGITGAALSAYGVTRPVIASPK